MAGFIKILAIFLVIIVIIALILSKVRNNSEYSSYDIESIDVKMVVDNPPESEEVVEMEAVLENHTLLYNAKEIHESIIQQFKLTKEQFTINISPDFNEDELMNIMNDEYYAGTYFEGAISGGEFKSYQCGDKIQIVMDMKYWNTKEQEDFIDTEVKRIIEEIINPDMTEFQKIKAVHDHIIKNTNYSEDTENMAYSAYTLLKEGKGVCQAYTLLTYRFLEELGIECYYITGQGKSAAGNDWEPHGWNLVKVNDEYYNLDVTWDGAVSTNGQKILRYKYFLVSDRAMRMDHRRNDRSFPKAVDKAFERIRYADKVLSYKELESI